MWSDILDAGATIKDGLPGRDKVFVAAGKLLPGEAATLSGVLEARRKDVETLELELRIAAL